MASHNETGKESEDKAVSWLTENGFTVLHRNWRHLYYELDIVATREKYLCFIEVKSRTGDYFGFPETAVTKRKFRNLRRAADQYLYLNPGYSWIQFHVLAITLYKDKPAEYFLLEDVCL
jgi:putative endonuclease